VIKIYGDKLFCEFLVELKASETMKSMKKKFKDIYNFVKTTVKSWLARQPYREGAVMAYNAVFALPGLLVVVITLAGYFLGNEVITGHLHKQITAAMGNDTADQVQQMVLMSKKIFN
jgi:membrane protein